MDMNMGMGTGTENSTMMKPYIHFTPGDILFFSSWVPTTPGVFFGACLALFVVAVFERFVAALGRVAKNRWSASPNTRSHKSSASITSRSPLSGAKDSESVGETANDVERHAISTTRRLSAPFILRVEFQRGALRAGGAILGYILMLAVMTFNAGLIISIVVGVGIGETLFGRFGTV